MVTVALIGADGAGKTSVARRLEESSRVPIKYIYMGANPEACNHTLPTTRAILRIKRWLGRDAHAGGPPDPERRRADSRGLLKRIFSGIKSPLRLANQLAEEWYRQCIAVYYQWRGYVVLFDRHFYADHYAHDICGSSGPRSLSRRIHGFCLNRMYPRPDLVVLLDAPAQILFDRKREGTVDLVERRRLEYLSMRDFVPNFTIVNADQSLSAVADEVLEVIQEFRGGSTAK